MTDSEIVALLAERDALKAEVSQVTAERDTERSRFAFWAEKSAEVLRECQTKSEWGHLRYRIFAFFTEAARLFAEYAAGQPSPANWRRRTEAAEAALSDLRARETGLREELDSANARFCDAHRGIWRASGCLACSVIAGGETEKKQRETIAALSTQSGHGE